MAKLKTNKTKLVKEHLLEVGHITSWIAIEKYGATRLSAIIFNLRDAGMDIKTENIEWTDRYGNETSYAKYVLNR
jgi:hypothetical protein